MALLQKTRKINAMLQNAAGKPVNFKEMAETLRDVIDSNIFVVSRRGKLLGFSINQQIENDRMKKCLKSASFLKTIQKVCSTFRKLHPTLTLTANIRLSCGKPRFVQAGLTTVVPIIGGGERLGTLILSRLQEKFEDDDLILAEYGATVVGMEILREKAEEIEEEARSKAVVQMAISSLSYSELEAIEHIFEELDGNEGLLVASKIADRVGITRSVIVNALRKLESAGVIESRSLGMKGTYIKVLNNKFLMELEKLKSH